MKKEKPESNVISLYPAHKKDAKGKIIKNNSKEESKVIGELFLFDLQFAIAIDMKKDNFILGYYCEECDAYHPLTGHKYKVVMGIDNHNPIEFLTAMMPLLNHIVLEHLNKLGAISHE